ncbi:unnamed protein product [Polarella glacialis]|uniref:Uncharacterized protein n=1 Tax=Polarella glacialis TaxID=89957 RepID=A0A813KJJ2_POLGL|nr:unnamed protein product [Polarella glacialis]
MASSTSSFVGDLLWVCIRGGEKAKEVWGSGLRQAVGGLQSARSNCCRTTFGNPFGPFIRSGERDYRVNLLPLGVWAVLVTLLGKCDFSPLILARCMRFRVTPDGDEYVFYKAETVFPWVSTVGSQDLFSELNIYNFDAAQVSGLGSLADPSMACIRQALRFWKHTTMSVLDFIWALVWCGPFWAGFDYSGESIFERTRSEQRTSWGQGRRADSWAATVFLSWPFSARQLLGYVDFTHCYLGASKKCLQGALDSLLSTDRSFNASAAAACRSDFRKDVIVFPGLSEEELGALPMADLVAFYNEASAWVLLCMNSMPVDNKNAGHGEVLRIEDFGAPVWSFAVQSILQNNASHALLTSWGMNSNDFLTFGVGLQQPCLATSAVMIDTPASSASSVDTDTGVLHPSLVLADTDDFTMVP